MPTFAPSMSKVSLRLLLSRLTAIALAVTPLRALADDDVADAALVGEAPIDPEQIDPPDAAAALGHTLAMALGNMRPIRATEVAATWAISPDPVRRLAVAYALESMFPLLGDRSILDHLACDPDPLVRQAIARAAEVRANTRRGT